MLYIKIYIIEWFPEEISKCRCNITLDKWLHTCYYIIGHFVANIIATIIGKKKTMIQIQVLYTFTLLTPGWTLEYLAEFGHTNRGSNRNVTWYRNRLWNRGLEVLVKLKDFSPELTQCKSVQYLVNKDDTRMTILEKKLMTFKQD